MRDRDAFYFGPTGDALFGIYHPPQKQRDAMGVLLCYPMGQEYIRTHRAFVQLAVRLARAGLPTLRFDMFGCGDSTGDFEQARVERWVRDTLSAADELGNRATVDTISMAGLRMGATLAALAAEKRGDVHSLVLWNPIVDGAIHCDELKAMQRDLLRYSYVKPVTAGVTGAEILGFPFHDDLTADIGAINLLGLTRRPADQVLLVDSQGDERISKLGQHLKELGAQVYAHRFDGPTLWLEEPFREIVPAEIWQYVVSWLSGAAR